MSVGCPQLQFGIIRGPQANRAGPLGTGGAHTQAPDHLCVTAIEPLGQSQERAEQLDGLAQAIRQRCKALVRSSRCRLTVVASHQRDDIDFDRLEATQIAVLDQIVRMLVMAFVADMRADVVQQRCIFQPLAFARSQVMAGLKLIEQLQCQFGYLLGVIRQIVAPLAQFDHGSTTHIGISLDLLDVRTISSNVVEHQPLAQCEIAQHQIVGSEFVQ